MTTSQAVDLIATHRCRLDPSLKIRPEICQLRRDSTKKISNPYILGQWHVHDVCVNCPGAVLPGEEVEKPIRPVQQKRESPHLAHNTHAIKPYRCRVCGTTNPDDFYHGYKGICRQHYLEQQAARQRKEYAEAKKRRTRLNEEDRK
jgi:hypothetical protein